MHASEMTLKIRQYWMQLSYKNSVAYFLDHHVGTRDFLLTARHEEPDIRLRDDLSHRVGVNVGATRCRNVVVRSAAGVDSIGVDDVG